MVNLEQYRFLFYLVVIFAIKLDTLAVTAIEINETQQHFDYLLVVDFEANFWDPNTTNQKYGIEMIEFACILYDVKHDKTLSEFREYLKPVKNPIVNKFAIRTTGIEQSKIDKGISLSTCMTKFMDWLKDNEEKYDFKCTSEPESRCIPAAWTDWHLNKCLQYECLRKNLKYPEVLSRWVELRYLFKEFHRQDVRPLYHALRTMDIEVDRSKLHGLYDARNVLKLIRAMIQKGAVLRETSIIR